MLLMCYCTGLHSTPYIRQKIFQMGGACREPLKFRYLPEAEFSDRDHAHNILNPQKRIVADIRYKKSRISVLQCNLDCDIKCS